MPEIAKSVVLNLKQRKLFVDGEEFPWAISEEGPRLEWEGINSIGAVTLTILADAITVVPDQPSNDPHDIY